MTTSDTDTQQPATHTPRPWWYGAPRPGRIQIEGSVDGEKLWLVAEVVGDDVKAEANARLIAAAPELLASLKEAVHLFETYGLIANIRQGVEDKFAPGRWVNQARNAIAKAEIGHHAAGRSVRGISMDFTHYKYEQHHGWPPDGEPGFFFGFDADMNSALLTWLDGKWFGVRFQLDLPRGPTPQMFLRGPGTEHFVVTWARAPWCHSLSSPQPQKTEGA